MYTEKRLLTTNHGYESRGRPRTQNTAADKRRLRAAGYYTLRLRRDCSTIHFRNGNASLTNKIGLFPKRHAADTDQPNSLRPHTNAHWKHSKRLCKSQSRCIPSQPYLQQWSNGRRQFDQRMTRCSNVLRRDEIRCSLTPQPKYRKLPS